MMYRRVVTLAVVAALLGAASPPAAAQTTPAGAPLRIGLIMSFTGGTSWQSKVSDAVIGTFEKLHGDTVAGRKLVFVIRDDTGIAPEVAARLAQELIVQEHVDVLVGTNLTPNAIAVARVSSQAKKPFFVINSATSNVLKDNPYSSRYGFTTQQFVPPLAVYSVNHY